LAHNLLDVGRLEDLDLETYRNLARMLVIHSNFMREIERLNAYQIDHVDPLLNEGDAAFFDPASGALRRRHAMLPLLTRNLAGFAEVTVTLAEQLIRTIESRYGLEPAELSPQVSD
jgi:hypothetical protein